jgi:ligand-binding sensor domain-containing protein
VGGKAFSLFTMLPPIVVADIMEDNAGNIWFASEGKGVFCYNGNRLLISMGKKV